MTDPEDEEEEKPIMISIQIHTKDDAEWWLYEYTKAEGMKPTNLTDNK